LRRDRGPPDQRPPRLPRRRPLRRAAHRPHRPHDPPRHEGALMRRHELDPVSLTFGFAFTGLGLLFLLGRADQALRLHWVWPILLLVLGVGILADLARGRDSPQADQVRAPPRLAVGYPPGRSPYSGALQTALGGAAAGARPGSRDQAVRGRDRRVVR